MDVKNNRNVWIHNNYQVAKDAVLNGNVWYCGHDSQVHAVAIKLIPISSGTDIAPWESEVYSPGTFSTTFQKAAGFYQSAPFKNVNIEKTFALVARVIDDPGAGMDDSVLAEDRLFEFTICPTYNGTDCF
jgi:hypothetical protein